MEQILLGALFFLGFPGPETNFQPSSFPMALLLSSLVWLGVENCCVREQAATKADARVLCVIILQLHFMEKSM